LGWLSLRRKPVLEALHVQRAATEYSDLNLHGIGGVGPELPAGYLSTAGKHDLSFFDALVMQRRVLDARHRLIKQQRCQLPDQLLAGEVTR
jgi:hypothetical protein